VEAVRVGEAEGVMLFAALFAGVIVLGGFIAARG
jgi:hypothetical protein